MKTLFLAALISWQAGQAIDTDSERMPAEIMPSIEFVKRVNPETGEMACALVLENTGGTTRHFKIWADKEKHLELLRENYMRVGVAARNGEESGWDEPMAEEVEVPPRSTRKIPFNSAVISRSSLRTGDRFRVVFKYDLRLLNYENHVVLGNSSINPVIYWSVFQPIFVLGADGIPWLARSINPAK